MCDIFDDFDGFGENGFMDDDSFEDSLEGDLDEPYTADNEPEDGLDEAESKHNDFTARDAWVVGGAMGYAYEEGLNERKRRKRKRYSDESD